MNFQSFFIIICCMESYVTSAQPKRRSYYVVSVNARWGANISVEFQDTSEESCRQECSLRSSCLGFDFSKISRLCQLSQSRPPFGALLSRAKTFSHHQKICTVEEDQTRECPRLDFERLPQHSLLGVAMATFHNESLPSCLHRCSAFTRLIHGERVSCNSALYFGKDGACVVNAVDRFSHPPSLLMLVELEGGFVDYFEPLRPNVRVPGPPGATPFDQNETLVH